MFSEKLNTIRKNLGQECNSYMKEEFEITLHAPRLPGGCSALVKISPIVADFRPVASWCYGRQLGWVDWRSRSAAGAGVRGGEAKEEMRNREDGKKMKKKKKEE